MKKSLLDIQQEIRELDKKIKDISLSISEIYDEIDALRDDGPGGIDYEMIQLMARNLSFGKHPLTGFEDNYACRIYLETLLSLVQADQGSKGTVNRLIFVQWLLTQTSLELTLEELMKVSLKFNTGTFAEVVEVIPEPYRKHLVMDALLTANICGQASESVLLYVVNLCGILGVEKEQLCILSVLAKGILQQNIEIKTADLDQVLAQAKFFQHYLNNKITDAVIHAQRAIAVEAPDNTHHNFKWNVKQQCRVEKDDVIATYYADGWSKVSLTELKAPCSGTIFQFRNKSTNYGVIAHKSDNKDSIKEWTIQRIQGYESN